MGRGLKALLKNGPLIGLGGAGKNVGKLDGLRRRRRLLLLLVMLLLRTRGEGGRVGMGDDVVVALPGI